MKSRRRNHRPKRSRWAHVNTPPGLRNRKAKADAKREAIAAKAPPAYTPPEPLTHWQRIVIDLYVPTGGRCDQHAVMIDGEVEGLLSATELAAKVRGLIRKRPSIALQAEIRREEWRDALHSARLAGERWPGESHEAALAALHPPDLPVDCGLDPHAP